MAGRADRRRSDHAGGRLDDRFELPAGVKLAGQVLAAVIVVHFGVAVKVITLPFVGRLSFPNTGVLDAGPVLTVIGLVAMMNVVNFSDGVDGLAAGVCAIIAAAMAVIAFDLGRQQPGVLAALTAGAALGFLLYNFPPASSFMGDCGANLFGLLMGVITVEAAVKTTAVVSFVLPLILLAVPFLDTTFVVLKRLKYQPPDIRSRQRALPPSHGPDRLLQQAHDRLPVCVDAAAGGTRAGVAVRPLQRPPRPPAHRLDAGDGRDRCWSWWRRACISSMCWRSSSSAAWTRSRLRRLRPDASPAEIERDVARDFETG